MTARTDLEVFRAALLAASSRAQINVATLVGGLDLYDRDRSRDVLLAAVPDVVSVYGEIAAVAAVDYYETAREDAAAVGAFTPALASSVPTEQIHASTRWAIGGLYVPDGALDAAAVLGNLRKVTDRLVKRPGRETIASALTDDPARPRFARVPTGAVTCKFCAGLASRGAVYLSEDTAGQARDFHDHCDCAIYPVFDGADLPEGYDPDYYLGIYQESGGAAINFRRQSA